MDKITKITIREIISDFAKAIKEHRRPGGKPENPDTTVIDFRDDRSVGNERPIYKVPIEFLRYRKENGRLASLVSSYESDHAPLIETTEDCQQKLHTFLESLDEKINIKLKNSITHGGQIEPAIITCDGFIINGNRRKMTFQNLYHSLKYKGDPKFATMKVVILPSEDDPGGAPNILEIEKLENRYQLHSDGKAEYYGLNKALTIRRKIRLGYSLEEQLKDDSEHAYKSKKEFSKALEVIHDDYLRPLDCVDRYLDRLGREGLYNSIATGPADKEGRWESFVQYYQTVFKKLGNEKSRVKLGVEEDKVGLIEHLAFLIIRKRDFTGIKRTSNIMREIPKWVSNKASQKEFFKLENATKEIEDREKYDKDGNELGYRELDKKWAAINSEVLINQIKKAQRIADRHKEIETPIGILEATVKKLQHKDLQPSSITYRDLEKAMALLRQIKKLANDLENEVYDSLKKFKVLKSRSN